jgi:hypothetical protein
LSGKLERVIVLIMFDEEIDPFLPKITETGYFEAVDLEWGFEKAGRSAARDVADWGLIEAYNIESSVPGCPKWGDNPTFGEWGDNPTFGTSLTWTSEAYNAIAFAQWKDPALQAAFELSNIGWYQV